MKPRPCRPRGEIVFARAFVAALALIGCGEAATAPPPTSLRVVPASAPPPAASSTPPPSTTLGEATAPGPPLPLGALLPDAPSPVRLDHARTLAREERWLEAAAVYDALATARPTEARLFSGRGFALFSSGEARALPFARADLLHAIELSADDTRLRAMARHNLGLLEERSGDPAAALAAFVAADRDHCGVRATLEAITRLGGTPGPCAGAGGNGTMGELRSATAATDLRDVVRVITNSARDAWLDRGAPIPSPATEEEARSLLGDDFSPTEPSLVLLVPNDDLDSHALVVPRAVGGYWVVPGAAGTATGPMARCPDEQDVWGVGTVGAGARSFATLVTATHVNYFDECIRFDDEDATDGEPTEDTPCYDGCYWTSHEDAALVLSTATGRYVVGTLTEALAMAVDHVEPSWPGEPVTVTEAGVRIAGCGELAFSAF